MPSLTILLPTYNGARFLPDQLESIRRQTFEDWQLLICDDGSSDESAGIAEAAARSDARIRIMATTDRAGQRARLGQLSAEVRTDLVAISDQDDIWAPDKLTLLLAALGDADLCFGSSFLIDENGREFGRDISENLPPRYAPGDRLTYLFRPLVSGHAIVGRRGLLNERSLGRMLPFDWLMSLEAAFGRGLVHVPAAKTYHRMHTSNQSNSSFVAAPFKPKLVSRDALRKITYEHAEARAVLLATLEHLAFAERLLPEVRQVAREAYTLSFDAWFRGTNFHRTKTGKLEARLNALLLPLAGSESDRDYARARIKSICHPTFSPERFKARAARLREESRRSGD